MAKKRNYVKGWLCRDRDGFLTFFVCDEPIYQRGVWSNLVEGWLESRDFNIDYTINFRLPARGRKTEIWLEV